MHDVCHNQEVVAHEINFHVKHIYIAKTKGSNKHMSNTHKNLLILLSYAVSISQILEMVSFYYIKL